MFAPKDEPDSEEPSIDDILKGRNEFPNNEAAANLAALESADLLLTTPQFALLQGFREFPDPLDAPLAKLRAKEIMGDITPDGQRVLDRERARK